jgi:hypothetical protein
MPEIIAVDDRTLQRDCCRLGGRLSQVTPLVLYPTVGRFSPFLH